LDDGIADVVDVDVVDDSNVDAVVDFVDDAAPDIGGVIATVDVVEEVWTARRAAQEPQQLLETLRSFLQLSGEML